MSVVQMSVWVPVIAALAGGLVASIAPIVVGLVQSHAEHRRELVRLAAQMAIAEKDAAIKFLQGTNASGSITPMPLNLVYLLGLLKLLEQRQPVSPAALAELQAYTLRLFPSEGGA